MKPTSSLIIRAPVETELPLLPQIESLADTIHVASRFPNDMGVCSVEELEVSRLLQLLFVADVKGHIVGFSMSRKLGNFAHLQQLSVTPDHGRKGIGASLLKKTIEATSRKKYPAITLTTFSDVRWNAPFYENWGFKEVRDYSHYPELHRIHQSECALGLLNRIGMVRELWST